MSELTDEQRLQLWRHSISLTNAPLYFAEAAKKERYERSQSKSAIQAAVNAIDEANAKKISGNEAMMSILAEPQRILHERLIITQELQSDIVRWGKQGLLKAIGFQPPRQLEQVPVILPNGFWHGFIGWDQSKITFQSIDFVEVRITTSKIWHRVIEKFSPKTTTKGRPSMQQVLLLSINDLVREGNVDITRSMASHIPTIRKSVEIHAKNQKMRKTIVGDETIRKAFSPIFKGLKSSKKL